MNSHFEDTKTTLDELSDISVESTESVPKENYRLFRLSYAHAQAEATLALAHEQHTANLISYLPLLPLATRSQKQVMLDLGHTIADRLGIDLAVDLEGEASFLGADA
jgi:hypothetical protein